MLVSKTQTVRVRKAGRHDHAEPSNAGQERFYYAFVDVTTVNKYKHQSRVFGELYRGTETKNHTLALTAEAKDELIRQLQELSDVEPED